MTKKNVSSDKMVTCPACGGSGKIGNTTCSKCKGTGKVLVLHG